MLKNRSHHGNFVSSSSHSLHENDSSENISVVIRVRPPLPREIEFCQTSGIPFRKTLKLDCATSSVTVTENTDECMFFHILFFNKFIYSFY
jgi:hypothetical protein